MSIEPQSSPSHAAAQTGFWFLVGLQALAVPFALLALFFGVMAWEHFSSGDKLQVYLLAVYPVWLVVASTQGKKLLKRKQWLAAYAFALSPLLLLGAWLPMLAEV